MVTSAIFDKSGWFKVKFRKKNYKSTKAGQTAAENLKSKSKF